MNNTPKKLWSTMSAQEHVDSLTQVLTRAGSDAIFRAACLDRTTCQATVEDEAGVTFDNGKMVRCLPDKNTAAKEILLILPDMPVPSGELNYTQHWICTYVDYLPKD